VSGGRERALGGAAGLAAFEAAGQATLLAAADRRGALFFILCLAVKLPFCALLSRRRPGAWLAVLLWELTGLFAGLFAPRLAVAARLGETAVAGAVVALLFASLPLFPRLELPEQ